MSIVRKFFFVTLRKQHHIIHNMAKNAKYLGYNAKEWSDNVKKFQTRQKMALFLSKKCCKITLLLNESDLPLNINVVLSSFVRDESEVYSCQMTQANMIGDIEKGDFMVNVVDAANYIVQLFFKTEQKYNCTQTKLEKLLSIANMICMKNNDILFDSEIIIKPCGVGISKMPIQFFGDIVIGSVEETDSPIEWCEIKESLLCPLRYTSEEENKLTDDEKRLLTDVFLQFGNCRALSLGLHIDAFKNKICTVGTDLNHSYVDASKVSVFFAHEDPDNYINNKVFLFIKNYGT